MISNLIEREQDAAGIAPGYLMDVFRGALTAYYVEERMKALAKQGKCAFVASCRGHEVEQAGITKLLEPGRDWFFTYYRSTATVLALGLPLRDLLSRHAEPRRRPELERPQYARTFLLARAQTGCANRMHRITVSARHRRGEGDQG